MIETSTPAVNDINDNENKIMSNDLISEVSENSFYNSIKPNLNKLLKTPSDKIISKILDFSKTI
jgi:hypothetical protein